MFFAQRPAFAGPRSHLRPALLATTALLCLLAAGQAVSAQAIIDGGATENVPGTHASPWNIGGTLQVGRISAGILNIGGTGIVNNSTAFIGVQASGNGTVTVDGIWNNSANIEVGLGGTGLLTIQNGGKVFAAGVNIGDNAGANGTATITGAGSVWTNSGGFFVGVTGTGTANILNGGAVTDAGGAIGYFGGGNGTVTVDGAGSIWTSTITLAVGRAGTGTLVISNGGHVSNGIAYLGQVAGGDGTVTVSGAGSTWTNAGSLYVGYAATGKGKLTISGGSSVTSAPTSGSDISAIGQDGTGSVVVTGIGSTWTANSLAVGNLNTGDLTIADGGLVTSRGLNIGSSNGATGLVHVTGVGSLLDLTLNATSTLNVGAHGTGTLTIDSGGRVAGTDIIQLGKSADGSGTISVSGANSRLETGSAFVVGLAGTGTVTIAAGGAVISATGSIGGDPGSHGSVTVTGADSSWTNSGGLTVATVGTGQLSILDGAIVTSATMAGSTSSVGNTFNSTGVVSVSGLGSVWNANALILGDFGDFAIAGDGGNGALNIALGGRVNSTDAILAIGNGSQGVATVSGGGSLWYNTGELSIGGGFGASGIPSSGSLTVTGGGHVTTTGDAYIARATEAIATADISGAGSILTVGGGLTVGSPNGGSGTLNISDGGSVIVTGVLGIAPGPGAIGVLNIGGVLGDKAKAAGSLQAGSVLLNGTINFNHTDTGYVFAPSISGTGTILQVAGFTRLTGDSSGFTGTTTISGGTLSVNGALGGTMNVGAATLQGTGSVGTTVIGNGGTLAPGNSIGTLTVNGDLTLDAGSTTAIELSPVDSDKIIVTGTANLAGTLTAAFAPGAYSAKQYTLLTAAIVNGTFATFTTAIPTGYLASLGYDSSHVYLNLTANSFIWGAAPAGGDWNTAANWQNGVVPGAAQSAEFAATTQSTVTITQATAVAGIQIDSNAPVYSFAITGSGAGAASLTLTNGIVDIAGNAPGFTAGGVAGNTGTLAFTGTGNAADARLTAGNFGTVSFSGTTDAGAASVLTAQAGGTVDFSATTGAAGDNKVNAGSIEGAGNFVLGANVLTVGALNNATEVSGTISGSGGLVKTGTGTQILSGANTYTGGTNIAAGTLIGTATGFGSGAIADNAALIVDQATDAMLANTINGVGSFTKKGAGSLNLTGTGTLSGPTTVAAGRLAVNGSLANSIVSVQSGATLGGNGTVKGVNALAGSFVGPGNSIGALNVAGNYSQAAGSTYAVELMSTGQTDLIKASGAATIADGAILNVTKTDAADYVQGTKYTVLTAAGGVNGIYKLSGDVLTAMYGLSAHYDTNDVYLQVDRVKKFADFGATINQKATGIALDTLPANGALTNVVANVMPDAAVTAALDQTSGEIYASAKSAEFEDSRFPREAALERLGQAFAQGDADSMRPSLWGQGYGSWGSTDSNSNAARMGRSSRGIVGGVDLPVQNWRVGFLGGYSRGSVSVNDRASADTSDNYHLGGYAGMSQGALNVKFGAAYSWDALTVNRTVAVTGFTNALTSQYNAGTTQGFGEASYHVPMDKMDLEPFANLAYVSLHTGKIIETGGAAALTGGGDTENVTFTTLGLRGKDDITLGNTLIGTHGSVGWRHAFGNLTPITTLSFTGSSTFTIQGVPLAQDGAAFGAGFDMAVAKDMQLGLSYEGQYAATANDNTIKLNLGWKL